MDVKPKPKISKGDDGWQVTLPAFGFASTIVRPGFTSREQAGAWLAAQKNVGSSAQHLGRTTTPEDRDLRYGARWPVVIR